MAVLLGGTLTHVEVLPSVAPPYGFLFGYVTYEGLDEAGPAGALVGLAPTLTIAPLAVPGLALLRQGVPGPRARLLFLALLVLPMFSVSMSLAGLALGIPGTDLFEALGQHRALASALLLTLVVLLGRFAQVGFGFAFPAQALSRREVVAALGLCAALPWLRYLTGLTHG
jgi:hypothetical protein